MSMFEPVGEGDEEFRTRSPGELFPATVGIICSVVACTAAGAAVDWWRARRNGAKAAQLDRGLRGWVLGMLISSYALLVPGLFMQLFVARADLILFSSLKMNVNEYDESMASLVGRLWRDGMGWGSFLVALYSMVIPVMKVVLLILGYWLQGGSARSVRQARACIRVVQAISKWASPDMFAYILLMYLNRSMDQPPDISSHMTLETGFTCFSVFCVGSTISSLGIRLPPPPPEDVATNAAAVEASGSNANFGDVETPTPPLPSAARAGERSARRCRAAACRRGLLAFGESHRAHPLLEPRMVVALTGLFSAGFTVFLVIGLLKPSMSLHMDLPLLYKARPEFVPFKFVIDTMNLEELLDKQVSVWQCLIALCGWFAKGEVNSLLAFILYAGFAVLFPIVDMVVTIAIALSTLYRDSYPQLDGIVERGLVLSRRFRKLAMLDVSIMGNVVVVISLASMKKNGVIVSIESGVGALVIAEVCHYLAATIARLGHPEAGGPEDARSDAADLARSPRKCIGESARDDEDVSETESSTKAGDDEDHKSDPSAAAAASAENP